MANVATLDGYPLPYNPNSISWGYSMNAVSYDTLGGRVVQLLSININSMTLEGDAGSKNSLIALYNKIGQIMNKHVNSEAPVRLHLPSRNLSFAVYVTSMPGMTFNVQTITYPYRLSIEVDEGFGDIQSSILDPIRDRALGRISQDIGFDPSFFTWIDAESESYVAENFFGQGSTYSDTTPPRTHQNRPGGDAAWD